MIFLMDFFVIFPIKILIFLVKILIFPVKILDSLYENRRLPLRKIFMIFSMIFLMIHKISSYKVKVGTEGLEIRWLGWQFLKGL